VLSSFIIPLIVYFFCEKAEMAVNKKKKKSKDLGINKNLKQKYP